MRTVQYNIVNSSDNFTAVGRIFEVESARCVQRMWAITREQPGSSSWK